MNGAPGGAGPLYIALATSSKQLRIVQAVVRWGLEQTDPKIPLGSKPLNPTLQERHVAVTTWFQHAGHGESHLDSTMPELSHLEMLPSMHVGNGNPGASPMVLTVRNHVPGPASSYSQDMQSIINRWELVTDSPKQDDLESAGLHPAWAQLGTKNGQPAQSTQNLPHLRQLPAVVVNKVIVNVSTIQHGRVIVFFFSDGTVQYRDRFSFNEIYNELNTHRIMHLSQLGFHFAEENSSELHNINISDLGIVTYLNTALHMAWSPTHCSYVQLCDDGSVKWIEMRYPGDIGGPQGRKFSVCPLMRSYLLTWSLSQLVILLLTQE